MLGHSLNNSMTLADLPQILSEAGKTLFVISYSTVWQGLFPTSNSSNRATMPLLHHYLVHFILAFVIVTFAFVPLKVLLDRSKSMDMSTIHDLDVEYAHVPHARRTKSAKSGNVLNR